MLILIIILSLFTIIGITLDIILSLRIKRLQKEKDILNETYNTIKQ